MAETTITSLPNAAPLDGTERVPMDQAGVTVDASSQAIADLSAGAVAAAVAAHEAEPDPHPTYNKTPAEIKADYESNADTNAFTDAEQSKLTGIEAGATA